MQPYFAQDNLTLYHGDLRSVLPTLPESAVDFVVTDPPYGLSFMEAEWDHEVPGPEYWRAIARVCKPGALMLAFGGTRTYHRLACAIEDAGWEIRDDILRLCSQEARLHDFWGGLTDVQRKQFADLVAPGQVLAWLHGQGFPKAADVGKQIDKAAGAVREVVGDKLDRPGYHLHEGKGNGCFGGGKGLHAPGTDARLKAAQITAPATPEATRWTGWANALKPAWEPIILAMKPMDGIMAHNALAYGVAGMNIDACRIGLNPGYKYNADRNGTTFHGKQGERIKQTAEKKGSQFIESTKGRWPANLLLDEATADQLDAQTGELTVTGKRTERSRIAVVQGTTWGTSNHRSCEYPGDSGGASRFFYCGKASKKERGPGNDHYTVKPLALMQYLLTLLSTPDGGVILDPFAGSGTTLLAAQRLGRRCIGVELTEHNCEIIKSRL
jgi:DNA modification methylase